MLKLWENVQNIGEISVSKAALPMQNRLHSLYLSNILKHGYRSHMTTSKHGIKIYQDGKEKNSCIILGTGAGTGIYDHSSVVAAGQLLVCCADNIFCLSLPDLNLEWNLQADQTTCFQIYNLQEDYIVYGELAISRIDKNGNIKWQYGGCDIFVTLDGEEAFTLNPDHIALTDFNYAKYKVDFNGKTIAYQDHKILIRNEPDNKKK
jgi:hypothetical protein